MRAIKDTYTKLCNYIQANVLIDNEPIFKWIDLWNEQTEFERNEYSFATPALFIDFNSAQIDQAGQWQDNTYMDITFYVVYETMLDTYHGADRSDEALQFLEIMSLLHEQLQAHSEVPFSALTRTKMGRFPTASLHNVYSVTYRSLIVDYSPVDARKPLTSVTLNADINVQKRGVVEPTIIPDKLYDTGM